MHANELFEQKNKVYVVHHQVYILFFFLFPKRYTVVAFLRYQNHQMKGVSDMIEPAPQLGSSKNAFKTM